MVTVECVEKLIRKDMVDPVNGEKLTDRDIIVLQRVSDASPPAPPGPRPAQARLPLLPPAPPPGQAPPPPGLTPAALGIRPASTLTSPPYRAAQASRAQE